MASDRLKRSVIANAELSSACTNRSMIRSTKTELRERYREITIKDYEWDILHKLFIVLNETDLDNKSKNVLQNIVDMLEMKDVVFHSNSYPIDLTEYEGTILKPRKDTTKVILTDETITDLLFVVDSIETTYGPTIKRLDTKLYQKLLDLTDDKLVTNHDVDMCMSILTKISYMNLNFEGGFINEIRNVVESMKIDLIDSEFKNKKEKL